MWVIIFLYNFVIQIDNKNNIGMEKIGCIEVTSNDVLKANIIAKQVGQNGMALYLLALGNELRRRMQDSVVLFFFHKKDGSIRRAFGTTMPALVKAHTKNGGSSNKVITYWDVEKAGWRSCQIHSLIKVC